MLYIVLVLVAGILLGPVIYLKPSPRQKHQMKLRAHAHSLGMQVKLAPMPEREQAAYSVAAPANAMAYQLLRPGDKLEVRYETGRGVADRDEWFWYDREQRPPVQLIEQLLPVLAKLPASVEAVGSSPIMVAAYWHEQGNEDDVELIAQCLKELMALEQAFFQQ